jgi:hypothetical protein
MTSRSAPVWKHRALLSVTAAAALAGARCTMETETTSASSAEPVTSTGPVHPGASSALCLDVVGQSTANGAGVQVWSCSGNANQQWTYDGTSLRVYGTKCLDVTDGNTANGTKLQIWDCAPGNPNQMWTRSGSTFVWSGRGKCVDLTGGVAQSGTPIQSWSCTSGNRNQQWAFGASPGGGGSSSGGSSGGGGSTCGAGADPLRTGNAQQDAYDCQLIALAQMDGDPDPMMAKAQIEQESGFDVLATSPDSPCGDPSGWTDGESKSFGLIQVTPACGEESAAMLSNGHPNLDKDMSSALWATSVYNPTVNLNAGVQSIAGSLRDLESRYPGCTQAQYLEMSAGAFNSGEDAVTGCAAFNSRAQGYVNAVLGHYHQFAQAAGWPDPY